MQIDGLQNTNITQSLRKQKFRKTNLSLIAILFFLVSFFNNQLNAQVVINEILAGGTIELKNTGTTTIDVSGYWLCDFPSYQQISNSTLDCGNTMMEPGSILTVNNFNVVSAADGEMGLYSSSAFSSASAIVDYVEWGSTGHTRSSVAVSAGIWTTGDFVPAFTTGSSLEYDGEGNTAADWNAQETPTICAENGGTVCDVDSGTISTNDATIVCVDGNSDPIDVIVSGSVGTNGGWIITDDANNILALPMAPPFDLDGAGVGICIIWYIRYEDGLAGKEAGNNLSDLDGCFDLSNGISVNREAPDGGMVSLIDGSTAYNGTAGNIIIEVQHTTDSPNLSYWYIITDVNDNILGFMNSANGNTLDLSGAPVGVCHIWGWNYRGLSNPVMGDHISTLNNDDCEEISDNFITVTRQPVDCDVFVGNITLEDQSTSTSICVDGNADPLNVITSGGSDVDRGWIITDNDGNILALPAGPPFDLDGAGIGTCEIWYVRYETIGGNEIGNNLLDLTGCFALSNPIDVIREAPDGGTVSLVDGSTVEYVTVGDIVLEVQHENESPNLSYWYIVTDVNDNILDFLNSANGNTLDLSGAPIGECHIWGWSYRGLPNPIVGDHISTLNDDDCEEISNNFVRVIRQPEACTVFVNNISLSDGSKSATICIDGTPDPLDVVTGGGANVESGWIITDDMGNILAIPAGPPFDLDGAGIGTCEIWYIRYESISGNVVGNNLTDVSGCFSFSNPITINRVDGSGTLDGGTLTGGPFEFCVGDGFADNVSGVAVNGNMGTNSQWIVTDEQGNILGLPPTPEAVDFNGAGPGVCQIWHLSYEDGLIGLDQGDNINDFQGCYDLSNAVVVTRNSVNGGALEGGPFSFCAGDGVVDNVSGIILTDNNGANTQWIVTDELGNILGLPPTPEAVNFDVAGNGTCLIWHLSYDDGLTGLAVDMNIADLMGCYDLSNSVTVDRNGVDGGTLTGGPYEFCVGDGIADNVTGVAVSGNTGGNSQWVVTDDAGNILGLPPTPEAVNFDVAGGGICQIWHLSYEDGLTGLEAGMNVSNFEGCYDLSNPVTVVRNQPDGGILTGGPYGFCVGDGIADNVSGVAVSGNTGANSQWVVTDDAGNILGLPPTPEAVNFDVAGGGICQIWHLSYEDGLTGLEAGMNISNFEGCHDLSNAVTVVRNQPDGGILTGGPYEFCVGDGIADNVSGVTVSGNVGTNSQWVVTDDAGNILGLPPTPEAVNFDVAGGGICQIWHLSYEDGLTGLEAGMNVSNFEGCHDLSNAVTVVRNEVNGGTLEGGPFEFCVGDGVADNVSGITLTGNTGGNSQWVVTDDQGNILGLPPMPSAVDFDVAGGGICQIWHLSYEDGLTGLEVDMNVSNFDGCYNLSNPVTVVRNQPSGGTLEGGPFEFCVGDGVADNVSGVMVSGNVGGNSQWVVTDDLGNILGLPPTPEAVNFDVAGGGICQIWHLSYEDGLMGLEAGMNISNFEGCHDLSNAVTVVRNEVNGGTLEGGPFEFCVGDGVADNVSGITLTGNTGGNSQWVVTDDQGNILGLPPMPSAVDFDVAGGGICQIWHLSYEDGLTGLEVDMNVSNFDGCYNLSNPVTVVRNQPAGGTLEGGPFEFCVGDGVADNVSGITLTGNTGGNSQWVVTDEAGNILGLPPMPGAVDFDVAGGGICQIWHLSYEDGLTGLEVDMNVSNFDGCYNLSNPVTVVRNQPSGGILEGGPFEFCVGDGVADNVSGITLVGNTGGNSQWVVTDDQGNILGLPPMPSAVDFDVAGGGICQIWHLSYEDGLTGLEVDMNVSNFDGCYNLSNPVTVVRNQPAGGTLEGGPFEFCVGDGVADNVSGITLTGNTGGNSQWVVTDEAGNILGLPPMPGAVDFDVAGGGICQIWHLSYEDGLTGLEVDMNVSNFDGCYNLSNPVTVVRNQPSGGILEGGPFEFCVGDGVADNVSGITLVGNTGGNSQWVVTDESGNILGLPPMPGAVDFETAPAGTCFIWHLSYEDGLAGLEMDMNTNDLDGCFNFSNSIEVVRVVDGPLCTTATEDFGSVSSLEVFPNPAYDFVLISYEGLDTRTAQLQLLDITGRTLQQVALRQDNDNIRLDVSNVESGYYFVRIDNGEKTTSKKLVIVK